MDWSRSKMTFLLCSPCSICVMILRNGYVVQSQWSIQFRFQTNYPSGDLKEFTRSGRARRRYCARSYAGWRRFTAAQPGSAHTALASLEKAGRIHFMITQNVDRLQHRAGSSQLELHGTVYTVACLACDSFQDQLKALNPKVGVHHNLNQLA
uniref:NAD-dependent protein deacetylase SRT2 n=1 Tax=Noccaea caerulescens TaxID=107243 RepID=A0A1J3CT73_NOCCA